MASVRRYPQTFDVFVGNLPEDADQKRVGKLFNKYGETAAIIVRDSNQPGQKIAYVKYLCEEDARNAIEEGGKMEIGSNKLVVRKSEPRKRPPMTNNPNMMMGKDKSMFPIGLSQKEPDLVSNLDSGSNSSRDLMEEMVSVTHAETPITVFVQISNEDNLKELQNVLEQLAKLCPSSPQLTGPVEYSKVYAAKFSEDDQWYRCQVKQVINQDKVKIQYIDYGNSEDIDPSNLVEIPQEITNFSPFALKLVLHNLRSRDLNCPKGTGFLQELTVGKTLRAVLRRRLTDGSGYYAELYHEGESISDKVIAEGHGMMRQIHKPLSGGDDVNMGINRNNGRDMMQSLSGLDKANLQNKRRELDKVTSERDMLNLELSNMRGKMKNLQSEYTTVSNKLLENNLNQMLQMILSLAAKVKQIRSQFPGDKETALDEGISLVTSDDKLDNPQIESLSPVLTTLSTYRAAQKEILMCSDKAEMEEVIKTRDEARKELFEKLNICVADLDKYPLTERGNQIESCLENLQKSYSYFIQVNATSRPLNELKSAYQEWKDNKRQESEQCRQTTDNCKQGVLSSLLQMHSLLSCEEEVTEPLSVDIDSQFKQYMSSLQVEVSKSDTEQGRDAAFLASLVQSVYKALQQERASVEKYTQVRSEFKQMITGIEPWLNGKPSTDDLQKIRKTLRSLKSKLRHRLADKEDHEENEGEGDELDEIRTDINEIRNEIHKVLKQESDLLISMSKLAKDHFPEVLSEFSEFGIDTQLNYQGLVQDSYEVDHFDLSPSSEAITDLHQSIFCGETVFIKEYLLGDADHVGKEQFLNQCFTYSKIQQENLHVIDTVFFDKSGRHGYIKSPKDGELLITVMESGIRPNSKAIQQIIRCLSKALAALHAKSFVHADITPLNIVMKDDGTAVLLEPDFSRSVNDRCRKKYVTKSGLEFVPPEIRNMADVTPSVDLYNLGLLILWLHYPDANVGLLPDNVPDFTSLPLDQSTQMILRSLLSSIPHLRPTVELLLQSPYHTMDLPDNLILSQSPNHFNPSTSMANPGVGEGYGMGNMMPHDYQSSSMSEMNQYQNPFPEMNMNLYPNSAANSNVQSRAYQQLLHQQHPSSQQHASSQQHLSSQQHPSSQQQSNQHPQQETSGAQSNEPFEIGTFDLADAMSSIPDLEDETSTDKIQSDLLQGGFASLENAMLADELQNMSVAENSNNFNIEAEKLKQETDRESTTPDSSSDDVQSLNTNNSSEQDHP